MIILISILLILFLFILIWLSAIFRDIISHIFTLLKSLCHLILSTLNCLWIFVLIKLRWLFLGKVLSWKIKMLFVIWMIVLKSIVFPISIILKWIILFAGVLIIAISRNIIFSWLFTIFFILIRIGKFIYLIIFCSLTWVILLTAIILILTYSTIHIILTIKTNICWFISISILSISRTFSIAVTIILIPILLITVFILPRLPIIVPFVGCLIRVWINLWSLG